MNNLKPFVRFVNKTGFFIPEHTIIANDCHVLYNLKDVLTFKIQGKQHILKPHSLIYYPYGEPTLSIQPQKTFSSTPLILTSIKNLLR